MLERADEDAGGAGDTAGVGPGSSGGHTGGESCEAHFADAGLPKSHGNFDAVGVAPQVAGIGWAPTGSRGGRSHLRAAACARGTPSVAPAAAIERLRVVKQTTDLHTDQLAQATLAEFLRRGLFTKHVAKMRKIYSARLAALDDALRKHMPEGTRWTRPEGGMCLWLELPLGFDASELLIHVKERGVLFAPGRYFYVQAPLPNTLRLGFASLDEKQIARGVATLAELLKIEMRKRQRGVRRAERSRVALV